MGQRSFGRVVLLLPAVVLLAGCAEVVVSSGSQTEAQRAEIRSKIQPTVRQVPDADQALLWEAALGYMKKAWPVAAEDSEKRTVWSKYVEWNHEQVTHRTRVTVRVAEDPKSPSSAQLRLVAEKIEPRIAFEEAKTGEPLAKVWLLQGNDQDIERIVADQIMRRYQLLRQGRNPDDVPLEEIPAGLRRSGPAPKEMKPGSRM